MPKILPNLREELLMVGREIIGEQGYQGFSMRAVAQRCGIGVGTLYNYYPSKQSLVADILRSEWGVHLRRMMQIAGTARPERARLEDVFLELRGFMQGKHNVIAAEISAHMDYEEIRGALAQRAIIRQQIVDIVSTILRGRGTDSREWLQDAITRLFLSYAAEPQLSEDTVSKVLERLLS